MSFIPFVVMGMKSAKDCSGHYLKFEDLWEHVSNDGKMPSEPPSEVLLKEFNRHHVIPDDRRLKEIAKEVLLSQDETKMWFDHLNSVHENACKKLRVQEK